MGESLTGVYIYLPEYSRRTVSGVDGKYELKNLRLGPTILQFPKMGYKV